MAVSLGAAGRREERPPRWGTVSTSSRMRTSVSSHVYSPWDLGAALLESRGPEKSIHGETHGTCNQMNRDFKYF